MSDGSGKGDAVVKEENDAPDTLGVAKENGVHTLDDVEIKKEPTSREASEEKPIVKKERKSKSPDRKKKKKRSRSRSRWVNHKQYMHSKFSSNASITLNKRTFVLLVLLTKYQYIPLFDTIYRMNP